MSPTHRIAVLVLAVAALAAAATWLPLASLPDHVARLGPAAPVVGVGVGAALLVALVPRTPVTLACGVLFGAATGAVCALIIALLAAGATFAVGRWLRRSFAGGDQHSNFAGGDQRNNFAGGDQRNFIVRHAGRRWERLEGWISREGPLAVAAVRAVPLGPYGLIGYAYGASSVRVRDYSLGTLVAATPSAISYAIIGAAVVRPGSLNPLALVPLAFGLLLWVAVVLRSRLSSQRPVAALAGAEPE